MLKPTDLHDEANLSAPFEAEARLFWLLGDKMRLQIVHLLLQHPGQLCVAGLASALGTIEQPTVSYHLSLLYAGGVVYLAREEGRYKYYRIKPHTLDKIRSILGQLGQ